MDIYVTCIYNVLINVLEHAKTWTFLSRQQHGTWSKLDVEKDITTVPVIC